MTRKILVSVSLIQIRSNVTQQMKEVAALESQINDMKADNDARYKPVSYTHLAMHGLKRSVMNHISQS